MLFHLDRVTCGVLIEERYFLFEHALKHLTLDGGMNQAHGGVVREVTCKLEYDTEIK